MIRSRYKCPKCRAPYCSIECCRKHKETPCEPLIIKSEAPKSNYLPSDLLLKDPNQNALHRRTQLENDDDDVDEGWKITRDMMDSMNQSNWLKRELEDGGLRQMIHEIETASNMVNPSGTTDQEDALQRFKSKYPHFRGFVDKLLVTCDVLERQDTSEDIAAWLNRTENDLGPIALKPIPRRGQPIELPPMVNNDEDDDDASSSSEESSSVEQANSSSEDSTAE
jgi:zinc finger HIT domain-containing protein 3